MNVRLLVLDHFGLRHPYRFERTLVLLGAVIVAAPVALACLLLWSRGGDPARGLSWGTPRAWYFVYLAVLLGLGIMFARWPRIGAVVLSLAAVETGLGLGSAALYRIHVTASNALFPDNYIRPRFAWHPLLQALPLPSKEGQPERLGVYINAEHLRGPEWTPEQLKERTVIALFGGSTTLDFSNKDGRSWADRLGQALGSGYAVINHGVPGYTTAEHVIQTAFYESAFGTAPHCSLYYVGWNDLSNAHVMALDPGYANYHMPGQIDFLAARRLDHPMVSVSPALKLLTRLVVLLADTARPAAQPQGSHSSAPDPALDRIFSRNVRTISAINRQRGIETLWIGQVMNRERIASETMRGWLTFVRGEDLLPLITHLNELLAAKAASLGDSYVNVPADIFRDADFVDEGHFSAEGAAKFASAILPAVRQACHR